MMSDSVPLVSPVPWASKKEFLRVANWIKGKRKREWNKARERMEMWKSRAEGNGGRMSAGCETSLYLLRAHLASSSDPSASALALVRFVNLISHIGERKMGMTKMHKIAARFGVPDFVVDLRHSITHGNFPSSEALETGVEFAMRWIRENYWVSESDSLGSSSGHSLSRRFSLILECHSYLRLYASIWDTSGYSEIGDLAKDQPELHAHLSELWAKLVENSTQKRSRDLVDTDSVSLKEASNFVYTEFLRAVKQVPEERKRFMARMAAEVLLEEELLLPSRDHLDNFDKENGLRVPPDLASLWSGVINELGKAGMLADLLAGLFEKARDRRVAELAKGWIELVMSKLCDGDTAKKVTREKEEKKIGKGKKTRKRKKEPKEEEKAEKVESKSTACRTQGLEETLDIILLDPSEAVSEFFPKICKLRGIDHRREEKLRSIMDAYFGNSLGNHETDGEVFKTARDLSQGHSSWMLSTDAVEWDGVPLGVCPGDEAEDLDLEMTDDEGEEELDEAVSFDRTSFLDVERVDWTEVFFLEDREEDSNGYSSNTNNASPLPAFYRSDRGGGGAAKRRRRQ